MRQRPDQRLLECSFDGNKQAFWNEMRRRRVNRHMVRRHWRARLFAGSIRENGIATSMSDCQFEWVSETERENSHDSSTFRVDGSRGKFDGIEPSARRHCPSDIACRRLGS